ncbi:MAG: DUF4215 domain-containing protein [Deltaproteobacteria bacterium]|nr:DUF4215 domain-containing protein [Deltaproteobacteria bacterium]
MTRLLAIRPLFTHALVAVAATAALLAVPAAAVPTALTAEGAILSSGGAVVDGDYALTFRLYAAQQGGTAVWEEGPLVVTVSGGRFTLGLGAKVPIPQATLTQVASPWLGVSVGNDPELPRTPLRSVVFALRAAAAEALECSGCVQAAHLDPKVLQPYAKLADLQKIELTDYAKLSDLAKIDLSPYAKAAELAKVAQTGQYADLLNPPKFADVAKTGAYADLVGLPTLVKTGAACGTGLVVKGIKADGSLDCVSTALDPSALPANGLAAISNGLLTNVFKDTFALAKPLDIPDASLKGVTAQVVVADIGKVQNIAVAVDIATSSTGQIQVTLTAPGGAVYLLHDKSGTATALKATYPKPDSPVSGDLSTWIGKNPAGTWTLQVIDNVPGKEANDGQINAFSVQVEYVSDKKVAATGALLMPGSPSNLGPCGSGNKGQMAVNTAKAGLDVCDGADWQFMPFVPLCGNKALNTGEECDDGNNVPGDGCHLCKLAKCGDGIVQAGEECDNGSKNSDSAADACRTTCKLAKCGDNVVDSKEGCDDGNSNDSDGCTNSCQKPCSGGWMYDGVCLKSNTLSANADAVPGGCTPYQPVKNWQKADYVNICNQFKVQGTTCETPDTDADGGLCANYQALASWENNSTPDVWLNKASFNWTWVGGNPNCSLKSDFASVVVYACK